MQRASKLPRKLFSIGLAGLLTSTLAAQDWNNYGGNSKRNGQNLSVCGPTSANLLWDNTDDFSIIAWHPFVEGERVFTIREAGFPQNGGNANDALVAYDLETGNELWRRTLAFGGDTSTEWIAWIAGVRDGRVWASRANHGAPQPIRAFDVTDGTPLFDSALHLEPWAHDGVVFAPDGDLIVGDFTGLHRIEATDGSTVWSKTRSCSVSGSCGLAVTDSAAFLAEPVPGGHVLTKYDLATGNELYSSPLMIGFTLQNTPFISPDGGTIYLSRTQNNVVTDFLYAFEDTGTSFVERWHVPVRWTTFHEQGIGPDGSIYTFSQADELVRLDPATGAVLDSTPPLVPLGSPNVSAKTAIDAAGNVYVSNGWANDPPTDGRLYVYNADLSQELFSLTLNRQNAGGPVLAARGTLIVCDRTGVYAYRTPTVATETVRLGSPPNPNALLPGVTSAPILGQVWDPVIDHTTFLPNATLDFLAINEDGVQLNFPLAIGTLLCNPPTPDLVYFSPPSVPFQIGVPVDCDLLGRDVCTQGGSFAPGMLRLTNAIDVVVGSL